MQKLLFISSFFLYSFKVSCPLEKDSFLAQANELIKTSSTSTLHYTLSDPERALKVASVWLELEPQYLKRDLTFLKGVGVQAFLAPNSKKAIDKNTIFINDLSVYQGLEKDFQLALQNFDEYSHLFHLTEIEEKDWKFLPTTSPCMLDKKTLLFLTKKYPLLTDLSVPYFSTPLIVGVDKKFRRWIYPKYLDQSVALLNFFDPSFLANRICSGKILEKRKTATFLNIPEKREGFSLFETNLFSMMIRKYGGFSTQKITLPLSECFPYTQSGADFISHPILKTAFIHTLLTEDTSLIRSVYKEMICNKLELKQFVHEQNALFPHFLTGNYLNNLSLKNLLVEDQNSLFEYDSPYLNSQDGAIYSSNMGFFRSKYKKDAKKAHLLCSFFHAMQPGVFFLSSQDIRGEYYHFKKKKCFNFYPPIKTQLLDPDSYLIKLQDLIRIRSLHFIDQASLFKVLDNNNKKIFCFLLKNLENNLILMIINFSNDPTTETLTTPSFQNTYAIDLFTEKSYPKIYNQRKLGINLQGLETKCLLLKKKIIDQN